MRELNSAEMDLISGGIESIYIFIGLSIPTVLFVRYLACVRYEYENYKANITLDDMEVVQQDSIINASISFRILQQASTHCTRLNWL